MKLYRNHYSKEGGTSAGFSFHSSKADARMAAKKDQGAADAEQPLEVAKEMDITPTRDGIIGFLNVWAGHPDNG